MTFSQTLHGLIIGKCLIIQIVVNRLKKRYFQEKRKFKFIQAQASTMLRLKDVLSKTSRDLT